MTFTDSMNVTSDAEEDDSVRADRVRGRASGSREEDSTRLEWDDSILDSDRPLVVSCVCDGLTIGVSWGVEGDGVDC